MNSNTLSNLARRVITNHALSLSLTIATLVVAFLTSSLPLLILSGLMAYGRPIAYAKLIDGTHSPAKTNDPHVARLSGIRPWAVEA